MALEKKKFFESKNFAERFSVAYTLTYLLYKSEDNEQISLD